MLTELTTDTLETEINQHETVLVQFSAGWCGNCRIMKPKFKKMASEHTHAKFYMIDAEKNPNSENWLTLVIFPHLLTLKTENWLIKFKPIKQIFLLTL